MALVELGPIEREAGEPGLWMRKSPAFDGASSHGRSRRAGRGRVADTTQVEFKMEPPDRRMTPPGRKWTSMQEEIRQLAERKKEALMRGKEPGRWREEIQRSIEREIDRRVRDALETPPLERIRRNKHRAKLKRMQREKEIQDQRKHLSRLSATADNAPTLPSLHFPYPWNGTNQNNHKYYEFPGTGTWGEPRNGHNPRLHYQLHYQLPHTGGDFHRPDRLIGNVKPGPKSPPTLERLMEGIMIADENNNCCHDDDAGQSIMDIKRKAYHRYTRAGFKAALRKGKLKLKKLGNGRFMDKNGIVLTADGPFWPPECGPLYPKQEHILGVPREKELLSTDVPQPTKNVENQKMKQFAAWEGTQVVFDAERISKGTVPHTTPDRCSPSLAFESRFESGNLRQARRVGQFEYDLVLRTDLYTNRHTQWFYFRVQKMLPGVTYKFNIVNLLKKDSLYNHGMRPLFYSSSLASSSGVGWHRAGHHITYCRNYNLSRNPLLRPEISYYTLSWQMEFPEEGDVCFLTHCYPYTFTDLCQHLDDICTDPVRKKHVKRDVLCESKAGNSCFLLTVGNFEGNCSKRVKKGVVVTARVHPGETNASWMMKGFLDFITSQDPVANNLRKTFTFKIVPMLNPDGVIVGNYRCSLSARDLNRTFRNPKKELFPTIWHTKNMLQEFGQEVDVMAYCDLHGHSRKHNIFLYGCDPQGTDAATFLCKRLFPWLISKKAPDKFSFSGCKFQVRRCKESTGRVVMWRQMGISNSFTMEATFCGSKNTQSCNRHFNTLDFQDMGRHFCEALLEYHKAQEDKSLHSEFILELTKAITQQVLARRGLIPKNFNLFAKNLLADTQEDINESVSLCGKGDTDSKPPEGGDASTASGKKDCAQTEKPKTHQCRAASKIKGKKGHLNGDISTSDSDSSSEAGGQVDEAEGNERKKKGKREKHKKKKARDGKKPISEQGDIAESGKTPKSSKKHPTQSSGKFVLKKYMPYVNRYQNRSNNGIPMFTEERTQERASKRIADIQRLEREHRARETNKIFADEEYMRLIAVTQQHREQEIEVSYKLLSPCTGVQHHEPDSKVVSSCGTDMGLETTQLMIDGHHTSSPPKLHTALRSPNHCLQDENGQRYNFGCRVSKYGNKHQPTGDALLRGKHRPPIGRLASRHIYTSDGQSSSDLDTGGLVANHDQSEAIDDFEVPQMFLPSKRGTNLSNLDYHQNMWDIDGMSPLDPFPEVEFRSKRPQNSDEKNNKLREDKIVHSPKRAQSSLACATSSSYFNKKNEDSNSVKRVFTDRQSELMKQKSAPIENWGNPQRPVKLALMHQHSSHDLRPLNVLRHSQSETGTMHPS